ncbi:MAG: bifunctional metallophosphatase/5'-nucleotidase [Oscillospiraceae bacterium]|jgi:2',3'-cyclic-nucleotide 2'-phosphodiesterase (5'-nucleotidase family)|nr:bifunctional metallophosphatase/5'-nucleotidase [Oscillospiraceae bacterium]
MRRNGFIGFLLVLIMLLGLMTPGMASAADPVNLYGSLVILHTNDIHGNAVANSSTGTIGYATVAKVKNDLEAAGATVLLLDAGDASQGTPLVNLTYGKQAFEFMNAVGYDAMAPGNHEFDWGTDNLLQNAQVAEFPIIAANIKDTVSGELLFEDHLIYDIPNIGKVGVFGLATPETLTKAHPDKTRGITFDAGEALYATAQAQVDALKAEGCVFIVALGHLGIADESIGNRSIDVINNTTGIDLFIDGHSHSLIPGDKIGDTTLVSTGSLCKYVGAVVYDGQSLTTNIYTNIDVEVAAYINTVADEVNAQLSAAFATTEVLLNGERDPGVRTEETNLGDFAADSILWAARQAIGESVVAAVTNGGGIRTSIQIGDITMNDMKTVFPFGNVVSVLTVSGAELLEALEAATFTTPDAIGAFPQVAGIEFTIDTTVPFEQGEAYPESTYFKPANPGSRITIATVGGEPFDAEALYTIATNDFTAAGGDTYYAFKYANATSGINTGVALEDALIDYVATVLGGVVGEQYAQPQGRITVIK